MTVRILAASAILLAGVTVGSAVQAQQSSTSGPATGGNVQPSTAVQKGNTSSTTGQTGQTGTTGSTSTAAGAPGAEAKPGTESGPAAKPAPK